MAVKRADWTVGVCGFSWTVEIVIGGGHRGRRKSAGGANAARFIR